jgi:hypothetical protein
MNENNVRLFQNLLVKAKNERIFSETNFYQTKRDIKGIKCYLHIHIYYNHSCYHNR